MLVILSSFSEVCKAEDASGNILINNQAQLHAKYNIMFASYPLLRCEVINRMRCGSNAVDE